jgi:tetratricopeptide (TPR) repeat protein
LAERERPRAARLALRLAPALLALLCFGRAVRYSSFVHDDRYLIADNPVLRGPDAARRVWTTGYWQPLLGGGSTVYEYRPLSMFTFALQRARERSAGPMHALNVLLHALVSLLVLAVLARFLPEPAALAGAAVFAVMPVHAEAVVELVNRSELLAALWTLSAWLMLDAGAEAGSLFAGAAAYALALLSKESAILFPAVLAASDWVFRGVPPLAPERRRVHAALGAVAAAYLVWRAAVVPGPVQGGVPYFAGVGYLSKLLTMARFAVSRYLFPLVTGGGLINDLSRPLIPDSGAGDWRAWLCLAVLAGVFARALAGLRRRERWAFWVLFCGLFLLPSSNLIVPINAIGAQRLLYLPSLAAAAGFGWLFERARAAGRGRWAAAAAAGLLALYGVRAYARAAVWSGPAAYYADARSRNPGSSGALMGWATVLRERGDLDGARRALEESLRRDPDSAAALYDLGRLDFDQGRGAEAAREFQAALRIDPHFAHALDGLALERERRGDAAGAEALYRRALAAVPGDFTAQFDLARLLWTRGEREEAAALWRSYLESNPDDPDAPRLRALLASPRPRTAARPPASSSGSGRPATRPSNR